MLWLWKQCYCFGRLALRFFIKMLQENLFFLINAQLIFQELNICFLISKLRPSTINCSVSIFQFENCFFSLSFAEFKEGCCYGKEASLKLSCQVLLVFFSSKMSVYSDICLFGHPGSFVYGRCIAL